MFTIRRIENEIFKRALGLSEDEVSSPNCSLLIYDQHATSYTTLMLSDQPYVNGLYNRLKAFIDKVGLSEFFTADYGKMNEDYENTPMVCVYFNNAIYARQITEIIKLSCKALNIEITEPIYQGLNVTVDYYCRVDRKHFVDQEAFVLDYDPVSHKYKLSMKNAGRIIYLDSTHFKLVDRRKKFKLPEGISWDTRNTLLNKRTWFNVTLFKNGKITSTKTKTVSDAMKVIAENRVSEGIWTKEEADKYRMSYIPTMENGWTVELSRYYAKDGPRVHKDKVISVKPAPKIETSKQNVVAEYTISKRKYNLPKYVCYDKSESNNRGKNVFQTQFRINGKTLKGNFYTVKDAVVDIAIKMLNHSDIWSIQDVTAYLNSYNPEMENGEFIPSDGPKSPSVRKREKLKNIKQIKEEATEKLKSLIEYAKKYDIKVDLNIE